MNFEAGYASFYDLFYQKKNYAAEALYVHRLIRKYAPSARTLLELGCGTGRHAPFFTAKGYRVHGVDRSGAMITQARKRAGGRSASFSQADIRNVRLKSSFDAAISLFHVMSYLTTDADLEAGFRTAARHLKPGGVFVFDAWYGPAVKADPPQTRIKKFANPRFDVLRISEPALSSSKNTVDIHYELFVKPKSKKDWQNIRETHRMRYLFTPEVKKLMKKTGFQFLKSEEWLAGGKPSSWNVCFAGKKK